GARRADGFAEGIERAGADVAVDDADAAERESPEAGGRASVAARADAQVAPLGSRKTKHHESLSALACSRYRAAICARVELVRLLLAAVIGGGQAMEPEQACD